MDKQLRKEMEETMDEAGSVFLTFLKKFWWVYVLGIVFTLSGIGLVLFIVLKALGVGG